MKRGFGTVEIMIIMVILALTAGIYIQRKAVTTDNNNKKIVKTTLSILQGMLETYRVTNETAHYPRSMRVPELITLLDKEHARDHIASLDPGDSLYVSDGSSYTVVLTPKMKKKLYFWSFHTTRTVFEGKEKPIF